MPDNMLNYFDYLEEFSKKYKLVGIKRAIVEAKEYIETEQVSSIIRVIPYHSNLITIDFFCFQCEPERSETITIKLEKDNEDGEQRYLKVANIKVAPMGSNIAPAQVIVENKNSSNELHEGDFVPVG